MHNISYLKGDTHIPLLQQTIGAHLKSIVDRFPNNDAVISCHQNIKVDYATFYSHIKNVAKSLIAIGVTKGDRVGIWSHNRYEWVLLQYATAMVGAILVNINPAYKSEELLFALNQSGIKILFSANHFKKTNYKEIYNDVVTKLDSVQNVYFLDDDWTTFYDLNTSVGERVLEGYSSLVHYNDPVNIQYTSGTTGFPKGVTLSHYNVLNNGYFIGNRLQYTHQDRVCIPVPFYHCFGMVIGNLCCTAKGATIVIPAEAFEPESVLQAVASEKCTSLYGVPTMFIALLDTIKLHNYDVSSLRTGVMAGSPCPIEIMKQVKSTLHMPDVSVCYGMTETSPVSTQTRIGAPILKQVSTVGNVMDHLEIKIIDYYTGDIVPVGTKGELCTRGYSVMLGYWNDETATQKVVDAEGWMHTGDEGVIDDEGFVTITGRIKDIIIRGGENISPKEIEDLLYVHEAIKDVQVIGVPDVKFGEAIMVWVVLNDGFDHWTADDFKNYYRGKIAHYKVPQYWKFVEDFPKTVTGKVQKNVMREMAIKDLEL